jgi:hypothetical protein
MRSSCSHRRSYSPNVLEEKFCELRVETVRKVPAMPKRRPREAPQGYRTAHFGIRTTAKPTLGALLVPFSDSFFTAFSEVRPLGS